MPPAPLEPRTLNLEPGARATPPCPHFGPCGGCQLQHLAYSAQLALKAGQLRTLLAATTLTLPEIQLHPSPPLAYRNRIRLTLAEVSGQLRAGYIRNPDPSNESAPAFLPITQCPIAAPILWRAAEALLALIDESPTAWLRNPHCKLDQLELFTAADESALQLTLYLRASAKALPQKLAAAFTPLCESLRTRIPELSGAGIAILPPASTQRSRRTELPRPGPTWGSPGLNYTIATPDQNVAAQDESVILGNESVILGNESVILSGAKNPRSSPLPVPQPATNNQQLATAFWVPRTAFFQVNRFLLPELLALVTAHRTGNLDRSSGGGEQGDEPSRGFPPRKTTPQTGSSEPTNRGTGLAWDLYAGVGLFARTLAAHFAHITAVEIAEPAVTALAAASKTGKLPNLRAVKSTTLDFLRAAVLQRDRPSLIVLDPPRSGAGPEVCSLLTRIAAPTLIYVSCSPETLPADLVTLAASGYRIDALHLLDLFPQTTHIETVAVLTR